ncbi:MAG: hypothetical protein ACOY31_03485 [Bacillota bacterium]
MNVVWEMTSDSKIWSILGDIRRDMDDDFIRLMFIEIFSRLKKLEKENIALRVLLMEENLVEKDLYDVTLKAVGDFLEEKDAEKTKESDFFSKSGVPFPEYVNFKLTGRFEKPGQIDM